MIEKIWLGHVDYAGQCADDLLLLVAQRNRHNDHRRIRCPPHHRRTDGYLPFLKRLGQVITVHVVDADTPRGKRDGGNRRSVDSGDEGAPVELGEQVFPPFELCLHDFRPRRHDRFGLPRGFLQPSHAVFELMIDPIRHQ